MRLRRSLLFVTGSDPEALAEARASAADTLILDLEDTVTPDRKAAARKLVAEFLRAPLPRPLERAVRVNAATSPDFARDLQAVMPAGPDALVVPKAESGEDLARVSERLTVLESESGRAAGTVRLLPLVETPLGVLSALAIAAASPRVEALLMGHVDLSRALGIQEAGASDGILLHARCQLVLAARAAGRDAIDAVFLDLGDPEGLRAEARQGRRLGMSGKLVIHESQVPIVHEAYTPSAADVARARRLVEAFEAAAARGTGVFLFEGRVIDLPVIEAERALLELARRAGQPEAR